MDGETVTPRDWRHLWLNEGFAMYLQIKWGATHGAETMESWIELLRSYVQQMRNQYGPPGDCHRRDFASGNVYYCPALMLIELRRPSAQRSSTGCCAWARQHQSSNESRGSDIGWLNQQTGRHLGPFVREWLMSPTTPDRSSAYRLDMDPSDTNHVRARHEPLRYLVLSGSSRRDSMNTKLAELAASVFRDNGVRVDVATVADFPLPLYDQDRQSDEGFPAAAEELRDLLTAADALVISAPEYNFSMSGVVKNAIDWLSRFRPQPFVERQCLLMSASPSMVGGNRGLWALRVPLEHLGARVYPDMFSLAQAHTAFDADGGLADNGLQRRFAETLESFADLVEAATDYPCMKRAWTEFLSEPDGEPVTAQAG